MAAINAIEDCEFINNTFVNAGVAIYLNSPGDLKIKNCTFSFNKAVSGSIIFYQENSIYNLRLIFLKILI